MKHIAFLALTLTRGGAERVIANLCNEYLVHHYKVTIITCLHKPVGYELDSRITHICIEKTSDIHYANMGARFIKRRGLLEKVLQEVNPDVLLCFLPEPNFLALSLKNKFQFPMIISVRNDPVREYKNPVYQGIMRFLYPRADDYVFQTTQAKSYFDFSKYIKERGKIIPNPLSEEYIGCEPVPRKERRKEIVNVGKLSSQKNQKLLIEAFSRIDDKSYRLGIYGEGNLLEDLKMLANHLGVGNRVHFYGNVAGVGEKIKDASLFILSSDYEGMPNALMEAMALGLPVIATDCPCGGPAFLIADGVNGKLVEVGNVEMLTEACNELLADEKKAESFSEQAINIQQRLHPEKIHEMWNEMIQRYI